MEWKMMAGPNCPTPFMAASRGAKPCDIPVEQATKFKLVLNL
jgi:hypothetical protein